MEIHCTRPLQPNEAPHQNSIADRLVQADPHDEAVRAQLQACRCSVCHMPLVLGQERYIPIQEIGQGGFGRAFLALDREFQNSQLVLKQLRSQFLFDWEQQQAREKIQAEAAILFKLKHRGLPRIEMPFTLLTDPDPRIISQSPAPQSFFYLVQEYVDGLDLERSRQQRERPFSEVEITKLLHSGLEILAYIHSEGVIHRDLKPSNIIYRDRDRSYHLIDFGAARVLQPDRTSDQTHSAFRSAGFSAPEVERGEAYVQSDLYSLAATCVNLLTGDNPIQAQIPHQLDYWHKQIDIGSRLVKILNRMLHPDYRQRYSSALDVLTALNAPRSPVWQLLFAGVLLGSLGILGRWLWHPPDLPNQPIATALLPTYLTRGEESIVGDNGVSFPVGSPCRQAFDAKRAGIKAFSKPDYQTAANSFKKSLEHFKQARQIDRTKTPALTCATDPETMVFWNNAKALQQGNPLSIAVSLPLGEPEQRGVALEMLTGLAQAQQKFNDLASKSDRLLQVVLTKDDDKQAVAAQVARAILEEHLPGDPAKESIEILGVVGHSGSDTTLAASQVYQAHHLAIISPSSSAVRSSQFPLGNFPLGNNNVFRTMPTDEIAARDLATYAQKTAANKPAYRRALIVYDSKNLFSQSLKQAFANEFKQHDSQLTCDFVSKTAQDCMGQAKAMGVDLLLLTVGATYSEKTKEIINVKNRELPKLPILAGDVQYSEELLRSVQKTAEGMVVAVPWHQELANPVFAQKLVDRWGTSAVSWRVATTYDATIALTQAITQAGEQPTRQAVSAALRQPSFEAKGATGSVKFDAKGDRSVSTGLGVLVKVQPKNGVQTFVLLDTPQRTVAD
jgi:ABC-type branched-subunit amino acid transport system substrate-binding protein